MKLHRTNLHPLWARTFRSAPSGTRNVIDRHHDHHHSPRRTTAPRGSTSRRLSRAISSPRTRPARAWTNGMREPEQDERDDRGGEEEENRGRACQDARAPARENPIDSPATLEQMTQDLAVRLLEDARGEPGPNRRLHDLVKASLGFLARVGAPRWRRPSTAGKAPGTPPNACEVWQRSPAATVSMTPIQQRQSFLRACEAFVPDRRVMGNHPLSVTRRPDGRRINRSAAFT